MTVGEDDIGALLSRLEGLEREPLTVQAERLEAARLALDEALARPAPGHG